MRPVIYGYLRMACSAHDEFARQTEHELRLFADLEGFCFAGTFCDTDTGSYAAFEALSSELNRVEASHVVVPTLAHLSEHPLLRELMLTQLALHANAHVLALPATGGWSARHAH